LEERAPPLFWYCPDMGLKSCEDFDDNWWWPGFVKLNVTCIDVFSQLCYMNENTTYAEK
jgi:hypothetical protein